jgi:septation ring formation regulator
MSAETDGVKANVGNAKDVLNELDEQLEAENRSFKEARETNDKVYEHIQDMEKVENYVRVAYDKDSRRFGLEDLREELRQKRDNVIKYKSQYENINVDLSSCLRPASEILVMAEELDKNVEADMKSLYSYKSAIDKSTDGESRAQSQLTKLQLVVAEVESKLAEYDLPSIDDSYKQDLLRSREYIERIRNLLKEVPLNIPELNALLDEAIDFIYKFYNNINNVVGMGVMVENAIVFGNKFRSTFPEIDRELSKAEFQYLNGEYTKALKTAIACMETLFPDNADEKIMENA